VGTYEKDPEKELTGSLCHDFRTRMLFRGACRISLRGSLERIRRISVHKSSSNSKDLCAGFFGGIHQISIVHHQSLQLCKKHFGCFLAQTATNQKQRDWAGGSSPSKQVKAQSKFTVWSLKH
jgi:hypothetical protein